MVINQSKLEQTKIALKIIEKAVSELNTQKITNVPLEVQNNELIQTYTSIPIEPHRTQHNYIKSKFVVKDLYKLAS